MSLLILVFLKHKVGHHSDCEAINEHRPYINIMPKGADIVILSF